MKTRVENIIKKHINDDIILQKPKKEEYGHFAIPVFKYASQQKQNPIEYAKELSQVFEQYKEFESVEAIGGFVNFKLSDELLDEMANKVLFAQHTPPKKSQKILLEYISANPTGPMHIGHARGAIYGDAILRIGRYLGYQIDSEYYVNDAGNQIYLLGLSIYLAAQEQMGLDVEYPQEYYKGEYIKDLAKKALEHFPQEYFHSQDYIEQIANWAKDEMLEVIKQDIANLKVTPFDNWISEKELYKDWSRVLDKLKANDAVYQKDGKLWLRSTQYKDEKDRVVVREDGRPTYLAGDIVYHNNKFERGYDKYINIWGADHHGYIARVKAAIEFLGYDSSKLEVLLAQMVKLLKGGQPYKMSKRAGNFILASDVVNDIGADALRFIFLTKKADTPLEFDIDDLNKTDASNPVFYVNYAYARINSIFTNLNKSFLDTRDTTLTNLEPHEKDLLFFALQLPTQIEDAFAYKEPHRITNFLINLSSKFHSFYNSNKVASSPRQAELLKILAVVATTIKEALDLLGIEVKSKM
ncbi:MAG: arginine--tRNA ligase [Epsilonproteobacteria bacterium]|nr:arginine--tRNA ligase [Campylobacterota bacterium]